jgi:hypothetical protein
MSSFADAAMGSETMRAEIASTALGIRSRRFIFILTEKFPARPPEKSSEQLERPVGIDL